MFFFLDKKERKNQGQAITCALLNLVRLADFTLINRLKTNITKFNSQLISSAPGRGQRTQEVLAVNHSAGHYHWVMPKKEICLWLTMGGRVLVNRPHKIQLKKSSGLKSERKKLIHVIQMSSPALLSGPCVDVMLFEARRLLPGRRVHNVGLSARRFLLNFIMP